MTYYDPNELFAFWKGGETLSDALGEIDEDEVNNEYLKRHFRSGIEDEYRNRDLPEGISSSLKMLDGAMNSLEYWNVKTSVLNEQKRDLLDEIAAGNIVGLGFEAPMKSQDFPQIIRLHVWPQRISEIDWDDSSFSNSGIEFLNIRLIESSALNQLNSNSKKNEEISLPDTKIPTSSIGRPTIKQLIVQAYELLKAEGRIDFATTLKPHTELIQDTVRRLDGTIQGTENMSYKTIYSHLSKRFNADKERYLDRL